MAHATELDLFAPPPAPAPPKGVHVTGSWFTAVHQPGKQVCACLVCSTALFRPAGDDAAPLLMYDGPGKDLVPALPCPGRWGWGGPPRGAEP